MYLICRRDGRGKELATYETQVLAMAKLFALQNTKGKGVTDIIDAETGEVLYIVVGQGSNSFPKVVDNTDGRFKRLYVG